MNIYSYKRGEIMFFLARRNLFQDKSTLLLSIGGTAFAILLMVILSSILKGTVSEAGLFSRNVGADIFVSQKGVTNMIAGSSILPISLKSRIDNFKEVKRVVPICGSLYSFDVGNKKIAAYLIGYDTKEAFGGPWKIKDGKNMPEENEVILDEYIAKINNISIGDNVELSGEEFRVVGFSEETNTMGSQYIFTTKKDAEKLMLSKGKANYYLVTLNDSSKAEEVAQLLENKVSGISACTKSEFAKNNENCLDEILSAPMKFMIGISFFIGIMIIGMAVYTTTYGKMQEFAVLKAIGASRLKLYSVVFFQSLISSVLGFVSGCIISVGAIKLINAVVSGVTASLDTDILLQCFLMTFLMSLIAAYFPIRKVDSVDSASVFN